MRSLHTPCLAVLIICSVIGAWSVAPAAAQEAAPVAKAGGFGQAQPGLLVGALSGLDALEADTALGEGAQPGLIGVALGGGGWGFLADFMVGGHGFAFLFPGTSTDRGDLTVVAGGGGIDLGYAIVNRGSLLVYPFLGASGMLINADVANTTATDLRVGDATLAANQTTTLESSFVYGEIGVGAQWFWPDLHGGFAVGVELGAIFTIVGQPWRPEGGDDIKGMDDSGYNGGYLRLCFGGGGFFAE